MSARLNPAGHMTRIAPLAGLSLILIILPTALFGQTADLFLSEYIEGSSNNKALEIYNGTGSPIDLAAGGYDVQIFFNGNTSPGQTIALAGTVNSAGVFVLAHSLAASEVLLAADQVSGALSFNGNDAVVLRRSATTVDAIGQVGIDPGAEWGAGLQSTQDNTLRRNADVCAGDTDPSDRFDPAVEWAGYTLDTFDGLGFYDGACGASPPTPAQILLTEIKVTPTVGEFVEIHNSTEAIIDLADYYLTDATYVPGGTFYYNIVTGVNAGGGDFSDFHARFPDGAQIGPGEYQTVALSGSADFAGHHGVSPTYELYEDDAVPDGIPDMVEALPGSISGQGGLTNSGEIVILYYWDGQSDLVTDVDYAPWGDKNEAVDKTGIAIDGPDGDPVTSAYVSDTPILLQDVIATGSHASGSSFQRIDLAEGTETPTGGNGVAGNDETSENLSVTWLADLPPSPGVAVPPLVTFDLKAYLEGPYENGGSMHTALNVHLPLTQPYTASPWLYPGSESVGSMPADVVDWLLLELRAQPDGPSVARRAVLMLGDGMIVNTSGSAPAVPVSDDVHVVLRHRNHLDVMSADKVDVSTGSVLHDFTGSGAAYGTNPMKDLERNPGPFGMYAGNGRADGVVDGEDFNTYLPEAVSGVTGYTPGDHNMDGFSQALDFNLYVANALAGATSAVP